MVKIYTGNHVDHIGVSDIIELIRGAGKKAGIDIETCSQLSKGVFILIDEFSSVYELRKLIKQKKNKSLKYILVSTEFETNQFCGRSFNQFENLGLFRSIIIKILGRILFWTPKPLRGIPILRRVIAFGAALFFNPIFWLSTDAHSNETRNLVSNLKRQIYMKARRRGYEIFKNFVDLRFKTHPLIDNCEYAETLLPALENFERHHRNNIKVSGTETSHRIKACNEFRERLKNKSMNFNFDYDGVIQFDITNEKEAFDFAYQPAQSMNWLKSNPVKIWRDLYFYRALPIIDQKFDDHPIEKIGILKEDFFNQTIDFKLISQQIDDYRKISKSENTKIFNKIKTLENLCSPNT